MTDKNNSVLIVEDADKKTRIVGMKWIKLNEGKDPVFDQDYFLTDGKNFTVGRLESIKQTSNGKVFSFGDENIGATHYCIPKLPL